MVEDAEASLEPETEQIGIGRYRDQIVNGPVFRTIFWLGTPPLVNQLVVVAYNVADTYWLSKYSELAVAVPRQMWPIFMLFHAVANALTSAGLSIVSQYIGGKAYKEASSSASRLFTLAFFFGGALSITLLTLRHSIFTVILSTPPEIFDYVIDYSGIIAFDVFFNYMALTYTTILQSVGDTKRPAVVNVLAVLINIVLDPFFILGVGPFPRLGVVGAALTDVMGKIISITALSYVCRKHYSELKIRFTKEIDINWARLVVRIGLPILTLGLMNGFAFLMQLKLINMIGVVTATAFSIGFVVLDVVDAVLWGLSGAPAIMIGQSLGAEKPGRAKEVAWKATILIFFLIMVGAAAAYPIRRNIADVFADDVKIIDETEFFLRTLLPTLPFFGLFAVALSTGRGSGHTLFPTTLGIFRLWGLRIGLGYFLAFTLGMSSTGIWLAFAISNIIGGVIAIFWIKYGNWAKAVIKNRP
ncbi:MAG: MATE family efflux transporter [Candidatus Bathyarchaeota archaeon]|nr:MATE family efflux transporter [Candidatus Bathyarchaeota archaeon]MDW8040399.1 MATE family efflux transporter [Nitrososphaerota archaeon]